MNEQQIGFHATIDPKISFSLQSVFVTLPEAFHAIDNGYATDNLFEYAE